MKNQDKPKRRRIIRIKSELQYSEDSNGINKIPELKKAVLAFGISRSNLIKTKFRTFSVL